MPCEITTYFYNNYEIRVFYIDGELWFLAKDLAVVLGYTDPYTMLYHVDECDKRTINPQEYQTAPHLERFPSNVFRVSVVNESGLYATIFSSTKTEAKSFKNWVTQDVLPTIRKTGGYNQQAIHHMIQETATITAQQTALQFLPYVIEHNKLQQTYDQYPGLKQVIEKIQEQDPNDNDGSAYTLKEAILYLGRPFLGHGEAVYCGQLICGWLNLHFGNVRVKGQPTRYKKRFLPIVDYAILYVLRKRGLKAVA